MLDIICLTLGDFGVNTYLFAHKNGLCILDPGDKADIIKQKVDYLLQKNNFSDNEISIVLTHGHLDHVGAVEGLKKFFPNAKVFINSKDKSCLGKNSYNFQYEDFARSGMGFYVENMLPDENDLPEPDILFSDLDFIFEDWQILETPGHTQGSSCLYNEKEKILFSGDTLFWNSYGRTDLYGGDELKMVESLKKLLSLPDDVKVFPGHGKYGFTLSDLSFY